MKLFLMRQAKTFEKQNFSKTKSSIAVEIFIFS